MRIAKFGVYLESLLTYFESLYRGKKNKEKKKEKEKCFGSTNLYCVLYARVLGAASDDIKLNAGSVIEVTRLPGFILQTKGKQRQAHLRYKQLPIRAIYGLGQRQEPTKLNPEFTRPGPSLDPRAGIWAQVHAQIWVYSGIMVY